MRAATTRLLMATPEACHAAITAFETYPDWQSAVTSTSVEERDDQGRGVLVRTEVDLKIRRVRYRLRYRYAPGVIAWEYVDGDVRNIDGQMSFYERPSETCIVTFALDVDPGRFVPGPVRERLQNALMRGALEDLALRVEGREHDRRGAVHA